MRATEASDRVLSVALDHRRCARCALAQSGNGGRWVIGADSFRHGHIIERLAQDVRALELFAGRTEALREAVADEILPK